MTGESPVPARALGDGRSRQLGRVLLRAGVITQAQLDAALAQHREEGRQLGEIFLDMGIVDQEALYSALAEQSGIPFVRLEPRFQDPAVAGVLPFAMIRDCRAIPLFRVEKTLTVAMDDPTQWERIKEIAFATGCQVHAVYTTAEAIEAAIEARTGNLIQIEDLRKGGELADADAAEDSYTGWHKRAEDGPEDAGELSRSSVIVDLVENLVVEALTTRASDIHLEPKSRHLRVRFRLDGILQDRPSIPLRYKAAVISRCKIMSGMDIAERRIPQDGAFSMKFKGRRIDFRVSTFPTKHGEVVVVRILDRSSIRLELGALGFPQGLSETMRRVVQAPNGILLVTGPTGSGKTSTLYALLGELDSATRKVITLEDPIEYDLPDVCQGQTHVKAGFTFATGLRSILRQDPDVIMVGEIRDVETAQIAIQASLTGHLVLSTLHTNSAAAAVARLLDMGLEPFLLATSLAGILAQRLVRRLCSNCKEPFRLPEADAAALGLEFPSGHKSPRIFRAKGCMYCNSLGYRGRMGLFEYISVEPEVQSIIIRRISGRELEREVKEARGFQTLREDGLAKVEAGETTLEEVLRVTTTAL